MLKRLWTILLLCVFLAGCGGTEKQMEPILRLRTQLLEEGCTFDVRITADYGDYYHQFELQCLFQQDTGVSFTVTAPESISGISGQIKAGEGKLSFDDTVLAFDLLADGRFNPVSAPWVFIQALTAGYLTGCGTDDGKTFVTVRDSYRDDAYQVDIWFLEDVTPVRAEIICQNRRILTLQIENFRLGAQDVDLDIG